MRRLLLFLFLSVFALPFSAVESSGVDITTLPYEGVITFIDWANDDSWILVGEMLIDNESCWENESCVYRVHIWDSNVGEDLFNAAFTMRLNYEMPDNIILNADHSQIMVIVAAELRVWAIETGDLIIHTTLEPCRFTVWSQTASNPTCYLRWNVDETAILVTSILTSEYVTTPAIQFSVVDAGSGNMRYTSAYYDEENKLLGFSIPYYALPCVETCVTGNEIDIWTLNTQTRLFTLPIISPAEVTWSPDLQRIATNDATDQIRLWSADSGEMLDLYENDEMVINGISWGVDVCHMVVFGVEQIRIWNPCTGELLNDFRSPGITIKTFSPNDNWTRAVLLESTSLAESMEFTFWLWDIGTDDIIQTRTFQGRYFSTSYGFLHSDPDVVYFAMTPEEASAVMSQVYLWDTATNELRPIGEIAAFLPLVRQNITGQYLSVEAAPVVQVLDVQTGAILQQTTLPQYDDAPLFEIRTRWSQNGSRLLVPVRKNLQIWSFD